MKKTALIVVALMLAWLSAAQAWVDPYTRQDETEVQKDHQSSPNGTPYNNNFSYLGSVNPDSGRQAKPDPKLYLERNNNNRINTGFGGLRQGPVYNPFTIYQK